MKNALNAFLLLPLFLAASLQAQVSSSCTVPPELREHYTRDVATCALQQMYASGSPDTALVRIPTTWTEPVMGALAAIYNAASVPERDSIFDLYCVHSVNGQRQIHASYILQVDTSYAWTQAWQNQTTLTGDSLLDLLLTKYHLQLDQFHNWSIGTYATLYTDSSWNDQALLDSLRQVAGVIHADPNQRIGAAGAITYESTLGGHRFDFYLQYGDCSEGCPNHRKWMFLVGPQCDVSYLGFEDRWTFDHDPLPAPSYCNISNSLPEPVGGSFEVFPNPTSGDVWLDFSDPLASYALTVTDMTGRTVKRSRLVYSRQEININSLPPGAYVFTLLGTDGSRMSRRVIRN